MYCTSGVCTEDGLHSIFTCPAEVMSHWTYCIKMNCRLDTDIRMLTGLFGYVHITFDFDYRLDM